MPRSLASLILAVSLVACAGETTSSTTVASISSPPPTTSASTTAVATSTTASATTTDRSTDLPLIRVAGGVKTEGVDVLSVRLGETVRFEIETDVADEVHVHGLDLKFETVPGEKVVVEFVAEAAGIFEIELEGAGMTLFDLEVTP